MISRTRVRQHPLAYFFALAYLFSWSYWVPIALAGGAASHFPGLLGPMLAAFVVTFITEGGAGTRNLWARMVAWRVRMRWYLACLVPGLAGAMGALAVAAAVGHWPSISEMSTMPGLPSIGLLGVFVLVLLVNGYGEEVGWRGFAWRRLRERHDLVGAAFLLGILWSGWHIPTFWLDSGMRNLGWLVLPGWLIGLMAGSVVLGWLYERSGFSLLIVAIFHGFLNMASATPATEGIPAAVAAISVIVWSVLILRKERARSPQGPIRILHKVDER